MAINAPMGNCCPHFTLVLTYEIEGELSKLESAGGGGSGNVCSDMNKLITRDGKEGGGEREHGLPPP